MSRDGLVMLLRFFDDHSERRLRITGRGHVFDILAKNTCVLGTRPAPYNNLHKRHFPAGGVPEASATEWVG